MDLVSNLLLGFQNAVTLQNLLYCFTGVSVGTLIGVAAKGNMLDKDGKLPRVGRALMADSKANSASIAPNSD